MKKLLVAALLAALVLALPLAAAAPKTVLTQKDVDKFITDFPLITEELDSIGLDDVDFGSPDVESFEQLATIVKDIADMFDKAQAVVAKSKDAVAILKGYGYDVPKFFDRLRAVTFGILVAETEPQLSELDKARAEYFKMIDSDKKKTKAQKDKEKKEYDAMVSAVKTMIAQAKARVSAADLALVKKNLDDLKAALTTGKEEEGYDPYGYDPYGYDEGYDPYSYGE